MSKMMRMNFICASTKTFRVIILFFREKLNKSDLYMFFIEIVRDIIAVYCAKNVDFCVSGINC
jgi:hypothetical protein